MRIETRLVMNRAQIIGTGSYAPAKVMTNADLAKLKDIKLDN